MTFSSGNQVDSRIVELRFDNSQFETNARTSLSTLDRLKEALDFSKSKSSIYDVSSGIKSISFGPLTSGLETVTAKFSALDVVAMRVISNITDGIYNKSKDFIESVSVEQISAGWDKYAEKTEAVQTIMAATAKDWEDTGAQMEYVNAQLEKLNWFTDETSFSFTDMVNNIGKFTSNNIDLDQSVTAMEGISTWAAVSGANINEAGRAMYNLSQAIATGSVKLMDWKSIENANMATTEFKQTAIETAESLGMLNKVSDDTWSTLEGHEVSVTNFNQNLSDAWFTSEVLLQSLERYGGFTDELYEFMEALDTDLTTSEVLDFLDEYKEGSIDFEEASEAMGISVSELKTKFEVLSDDALTLGVKAFRAAQEAKTFGEAIDAVKDAVSTGWMNTFETLFGDYMEAKNLWTTLANDLWDIFASGGEARNALLKEAFNEEATINQSDWDKLTESGLASPLFISKMREAARSHSDYARWMVDDETWLKTALERNLITISDFESAWDSIFGGGGSSNVDEGLLKSVEDLQAANSEIADLMESFDKWSATDVGNIIFGNHEYEEGTRELEEGLDTILKTLGLTQDQGEGLVAVLKSMGYFGGEAADSWDKMSEEELKALGFTDQMIAAYEDAVAKGKTAEEVKNAILTSNMSTGEMWYAALTDGMDTLVELFEVARNAWEEVFPPMTVDTIRSIVTEVYDAVQAFKNFVETSDELRNGLKAVFSVLDILWTVTRGIVTGGANAIRSFIEGLNLDFGSIVNKVSAVIMKAREWIKTSDIVGKTMQIITTLAGLAGKQIRAWIDSFKSIPGVSRLITTFKNGVKTALNQLPTFMDGLNEKFVEFGHKVGELDGIKLENIGQVFGAFKDTVLSYFLNFPGFQGIRDAFTQLRDDVKAKLLEMGIDVDGIKERLSGFKDKVVAAFGGLGTATLTAVGWITKLYDKLSKSTFVQNNLARFKTAFSDLPNQIGPFIDGLKGKFKEFTDQVSSMGGLKLDNISSIFSAFKNTVLSYFQDFKGFDSIKQAFTDLKDDIKQKLLDVGIDVDAIKEKITGFIDIVTEKLSNFSLPDTLSSIFDIFHKNKDNAEESTSGWTTAVEEIADVAEEVQTKAFTFPTWLTDLARAILALVVAITAFQAIKSIKKVIDSTFGSIATLNKAKANALNKTGIFIIASSIFVLAEAVNLLAKVPVGRLGPAVAAVVGLAAVLGALSIVINKFTNVKQMFKLGAGILMMASAFMVIALAIKVLETVKIENIPKVVGFLLGITMTFVVLAGLLNRIDGTFTGGIGILAIATAMYLLIGVMAVLDNMHLKNPLQVIVGMLSMVGLIALLFASTKLAGKHAGKAAAAIVAAAAAIAIMSASLLIISVVPKEKIWRCVGVIAVLSACVAGLMAVSKLTSGASAATVLMIGAMIAALSVSLAALSIIPEKNLVRAAVVLGSLLALISVIVGLVGFAFKGKAAIGSLLGVVSMIAILITIAETIKSLSDIRPQKLETITTGMLKVLLGLSAFMAVLTVAGTFGPAAIVGALNLVGVVAILGAVLVGIGALADWLETLDFDLVGKIESGAKVFDAIGSAIGSFFGSLIGGFVGSFGTETAKYLPEMANYLVSFVENLQGLNGLKAVNNTALDSAINAVNQVALTSFFDLLPNLLSKAMFGRSSAEQFAVDIGAIGDALSKWAESINGLPKITVDTDGLDNLCTVIDKVSKHEFWSSVKGLFTGKYLGRGGAGAAFQDDLSNIGDALVKWQDSVNGLPALEVDTEKLGGLCDIIDDVTTSEVWASIGGMFTFNYGQNGTKGNNGVGSAFERDLGNIADALVDWQTKMDTIAAITVPTEEINGLASSLDTVRSSSLWGVFTDFLTQLGLGESTLEKFQTDTTLLANALGTWQTKMNEIGAITVPTKEIEDLAKVMKEDIPNTGLMDAIAQFFGAETDVESFANNMGALGQGLSDFSTNLGGDFDIGRMSDAVEILGSIAACGQDIQQIAALGQDEIGQSNFDEALKRIAASLNGFVNILESNKDKYTGFGAIAADILASITTLTGADLSASSGSFADPTAVGTLVGNIKQFVDLINEKVKGLDTSDVDKVVEAATKLANTDISGATEALKTSSSTPVADTKGAEDSAKATVGAYTSSISSQSGSVTDAMGSLTSAAASSLDSATGTFGAKAYALVGAMAEAVRSAGEFGAALRAMVSDAVNSIDTSAAYTSGAQFAMGFSRGVSLNAYLAVASARSMAQQAKAAINSALGIASPSKEAMKSGKFFSEGFALGIEDLAYMSADAAIEMGDSAVSRMRRAISSVKDIFTSDMTGDPVIRPVLDLSEIKSGASSIGGLLSNVQPVSLMSDLDIIQTNSRAMRNRASTDDLLTALASLDTGGTTNNYTVGGVTYDDGSNIASAVRTLIHAVNVGRRV